MSDRIKKIKVKKADGSMTDYIPIGVDAENVDFDNGYKLDNIVGSINPDESGSIAAQLSKSIRYYDCVADMKADTTLNGGGAARTLGYYEPGDGGDAIYNIVEDNTLVDDGGSVHDLDNGLKAMLIIINNIINVKQFGVYGDNIHDDTAKIQKALNKATNITAYFPIGTYLISDALYFKGSCIGENTELTVINFPTQDGTQSLTNSIFYGIGVNNLTIENFSLIGSFTTSGGQNSHGVSLTGCKNAHINKNIFKNITGDGVYLGGGGRQSEAPDQCTNILIENNIFDNCNRCAVSFIKCYNVTIFNNVIIKNTDLVGVFDIEPNYSSQKTEYISFIKNKVISNGTFIKNYYSTTNTNNPKYISIKDNIVECTLFYYGNLGTNVEDRTDYVECINNIATISTSCQFYNIKQLMLLGNTFKGDKTIRIENVTKATITDNNISNFIIVGTDMEMYQINNNTLLTNRYSVDNPAIYIKGACSDINILNNLIKNTRVGIRLNLENDSDNVVIKNNNIKTSK